MWTEVIHCSGEYFLSTRVCEFQYMPSQYPDSPNLINLLTLPISLRIPTTGTPDTPSPTPPTPPTGIPRLITLHEVVIRRVILLSGSLEVIILTL